MVPAGRTRIRRLPIVPAALIVLLVLAAGCQPPPDQGHGVTIPSGEPIRLGGTPAEPAAEPAEPDETPPIEVEPEEGGPQPEQAEPVETPAESEAVDAQAGETEPADETPEEEVAQPEPPIAFEHGTGESPATEPLAEERIANVVERVIDCVVNVSSKRMVTGEMIPDGIPGWDTFEEPPPGGEMPIPEYESGSGVIISKNGYILTNAHLVENVDQITVSLRGGRNLEAALIGSDPATDIALLKVDATDLKAITLGDSSTVRIGQIVLAIGNPFQFGHTVTMGIISAKGRSGSAMFGNQFYAPLLQTDAAINPGNSGGALVDMAGRLIGINTAIASRSGGSQGVGFAVPVGIARSIAERLQTDGSVKRGWIGIGIQELTPDLAESLGYADPCGVLVNRVHENTPAEKAGIRVGDIVAAFGGNTVCTVDELRNAASLTEIGKTVSVGVFRNGRIEAVPIVIEELDFGRVRPEEPAEAAPPNRVQLFGMSLIEAYAQGSSPLPGEGIPTVTVESVEPGSQADEAGVLQGDVVERIGGVEVASLDEVKALAGQSRRPLLLFLFDRGGMSFFHPFRRTDQAP